MGLPGKSWNRGGDKATARDTSGNRGEEKYLRFPLPEGRAGKGSQQQTDPGPAPWP